MIVVLSGISCYKLGEMFSILWLIRKKLLAPLSDSYGAHQNVFPRMNSILQ